MNLLNNNNYITELFTDRESAEKAYQAAMSKGYTPEEVIVMMSDDTRKKYYDSILVEKDMGDKSIEGLALGSALGVTVGGTIGAIAAIGTQVAFPGLGLIVAGPLLAGLLGAGAGSISGGLVGALVGAGIPEENARVYEEGLKEGAILLGVKAHDYDQIQLANEWQAARSHQIAQPLP